jgi:hypothetical protein
MTMKRMMVLLRERWQAGVDQVERFRGLLQGRRMSVAEIDSGGEIFLKIF